MCNEAARRISLGQLREDWSQLRIPLLFPEGLPNLEPVASFRITDTTLILRAARPETNGATPDTPAAEAVMRRWSWPAPGGKPVYNYRADDREFRNGAAQTGSPQSNTLRGGQGRCLIAADAFYEFTDPARRGELPVDTADLPPLPKGRKDKWAFTLAGADWFGIAGLWRTHPQVPTHGGEAFTMLTCPPGADIAPFHSRQIVIVPRADWGRWLDGSAPAADICRPLPAGSLAVSPAAR